jgi:excisionase family DNA binding protein
MSTERTTEELSVELAALIERIVERVVERREAERRAVESPPARDEELTVKQVAALKGVRPRTVYDWVAQKRIPFHYTPGGQLRFYRRHLDVITSAP